jgi:hypothetical protein
LVTVFVVAGGLVSLVQQLDPPPEGEPPIPPPGSPMQLGSLAGQLP